MFIQCYYKSLIEWIWGNSNLYKKVKTPFDEGLKVDLTTRSSFQRLQWEPQGHCKIELFSSCSGENNNAFLKGTAAINIQYLSRGILKMGMS